MCSLKTVNECFLISKCFSYFYILSTSVCNFFTYIPPEVIISRKAWGIDLNLRCCVRRAGTSKLSGKWSWLLSRSTHHNLTLWFSLIKYVCNIYEVICFEFWYKFISIVYVFKRVLWYNICISWSFLMLYMIHCFPFVFTWHFLLNLRKFKCWQFRMPTEEYFWGYWWVKAVKGVRVSRVGSKHTCGSN